MELIYPVEGGGTLECQPQGLYLLFHLQRPGSSSGIYKAWVCGPGEGRLLLGTLEPQGNRLVLSRKIALSQLKHSGCWPICRGEVRSLTSPQLPRTYQDEWRSDPRPWERLSDPVLIHASQLQGAMLFREEPWGFSLAAPAGSSQPFPLVPLFCLAHMQTIRGRLYAVFSFSPSGIPILSPSLTSAGQTPAGRCGKAAKEG